MLKSKIFFLYPNLAVSIHCRNTQDMFLMRPKYTLRIKNGSLGFTETRHKQ